MADEPISSVCPLTGRVGLWTPCREARPRTRPTRQSLVTPPQACPFCGIEPDDPRLLGPRTDGPGGRWIALRNLFPPLAGRTGRAVLAVAEAHGPTLAHRRADLAAAWAGQLDLQLGLAREQPERWSLLTTAVGLSAGASQHHPHGQVLTPREPPPAVVAVHRSLARAEVVAALLAAPRQVAELAGLHLLAPPVPLGPGDLLVLPERPGPLTARQLAPLAELIATWVDRAHRLLEVEQDGLDGPAPVDIKTQLHDVPAGIPGRWLAELQVTDRHAPSVAAAPLVDLVRPPEDHAAAFRAAGPSA
ncbi:MAG: hypothetical protein ACLFUG_05455 [Nitriliruptoraceae bacterium]